MSTTAGNLGTSLPSIIMANGKPTRLDIKPNILGIKGMGSAISFGATGPGTVAGVSNDKHESWQMELLMERLRSKAKSLQYKSFQEMSKSVRMSLLEKRYALDAVEKSNLQKTLDSMQYCIKVTSRQGLVERLDCLTRQLGLKLSEDTSGLFISSDMFYLEIILDQNGTVQDVKVHHECKMKQQSCSELVSCLQRGDFADFTTQLEGLASIYQLNAEKKIKVNAFVALQSLETDLFTLYTLSMQHFTDINSLLMKSPLGIVQKRRGGHAMKLTYFVTPYDLLDVEGKKLKPLTTDIISTEKIGCSVAVNLEASTANKLQILPLLVQQGNSPVYSAIEKHNSTSLPATFVLRLNKPMVLDSTMLKQIKMITGENTAIAGVDSVPTASCLISLIVKHGSNGVCTELSKGLFVTLPDQYHCYYMTENKSLQGTVISSIPFTEPQHVPKILVFLRQQALFNQLLTSCIRNNGVNNTRVAEYEDILVFEVSALSCQYITVSLEHPFEESLAMVEFNLRNVLAIEVHIFCNGYESDQRISNRVSLIMQRTMSIPVTLRALIKIWEEEYEAKFKCKVVGAAGTTNGSSSGNGGGIDEGNFSLSMGQDEGGGNGSAGPGGGGGCNSIIGGGSVTGNGMNGQHGGSGNLNGVEFCDTKKVKLEPLDPAKKRRIGEDFCRSPKSSKDTEEVADAAEEEADEDDDEFDESTNLSSGDSNNSLGENQTNMGQKSSSSQAVGLVQTQTASETTVGAESSGNSSILGALDFSHLDSDLMRSSNSSDLDDASDINESDGVNVSCRPSPKLLEDKPTFTTSSSVSITPIAVGKPASMVSSILNNIGLEKRPGIEIIPLANNPTSMSSSITITPIPLGSSTMSQARSTNIVSSSDKKHSGNSGGSSLSRKGNNSDLDRVKLEKKKKRRHDEQQMSQHQMGPPHKIPSKGISAADSPSPPLAGANNPKYSVSSSQLLLSSGSPGSGARSSPKHSSPVHHSSPKHQINFGTSSSPKHISGGGCTGGGKPSMSALKSAASGGSPGSKSSSNVGVCGKDDLSIGKGSGSGGRQ